MTTTMSPKKPEIIHTSNYANLGKHHWKAFTSSTGKYDPGKANFKPRIEMLSPNGWERNFYDHDKQTVITVIYDQEYVYEHYYQKLVVSMGWMDSGTLDEDVLQLFFKAFFEYCQNVGQREYLIKIEQRAQQLAIEFPGQTAEQWKAILIQQAVIPKKEEDTPQPSDVSSEIAETKTERTSGRKKTN
ncbi:hypothetical protein [Nostoc sp. PA-18-2419]|uniref:hypothetical protein n=1 Tax=Nostoc sp. PA-18-2419 TaxID=2575443 RepID=UPI001CB999DA|nr:hypothetical protein [Nostoc sp. PA-18-2419]